MASTIEIKVPDIGGHDNVPVIEVLVKVGDTVAKEQSLITLESDKATMEIPSSAAGVVKELRVKVGDELSEGAVIAVLEAADASAPSPQGGEGRGEGATLPQSSAGNAAASTRPSPQSSPQGERRRRHRKRHHRLDKSPISNASWSCWAPARAAIRRPSAPPTWASTRCWSSVTPPSAASASTWAAFRPRRCCTLLP